MASHSEFGHRSVSGRDVPSVERLRRRELGPPAYEDASVHVWELAR